MEIIKTIINTYGTEILGALLTALAGVLGMALKRLATQYVNTGTKQAIARTVVQGVEQIYKDLHGQEKLDKAMEAASAMLKEYGITVTELELRMLLESALAELNRVFDTATVLPGIDADALDKAVAE